MGKIFSYIGVLGFSLIVLACSVKSNSFEESSNFNACDSIKMIYDEWQHIEKSNQKINKLIPVLSSKSGIEATCPKGTYGYMYSMVDDSVLYNDLNKWSKYFKCEYNFPLKGN